jgi:hypothetical protein
VASFILYTNNAKASADMKIILKIVLSLSFLLFFLIFILSGTFKFQISKPAFWENTFEIKGTYSELSRAVINNLENQAVTEGGKKSDVSIFVDLATADNLKDLINKNIENLLSFVNGKSSEINIYIPINRIPKSLLPVNLIKSGQQIKIEDFLKATGVASVSFTQVQKLQTLPKIVNICFFVSVLFMITILFLEFNLTKNGKRLGLAGLNLILAGIEIFTVAKFLDVLKKGLIQDLLHRTDLAGVIMSTMTPPPIAAISRVWSIEAFVVIILGVILFFVKKPYNNNKV